MPKQNRKVVRYRKPFHLNIGGIVFLFIFIYIAVISIHYFSQDTVGITEVSEKNISDDNIYKGIILRNETLYYTDKAGYINYFVGDGEKVAKDSTVYTIDETGEMYQALSNTDEVILSKEDSQKIRSAISNFKKNYDNSLYSDVINFQYNIENIVLEQSTASLLSNLNEMMGAYKHGQFDVVNAKKSGIISYTMDHNEMLKVDDISGDTFKNPEESRVQLRSNELVAQGSPVYKMVNSEDWNIIIPLSSSQFDKVKELEKVKITFRKDNVSAIVGITTYSKDGGYFANLSLSKYMIRYINDRFIEVELLLNSAEGLKIPVTSIIKKDFFMVPDDFVTQGGKTNSLGLTKETFTEKGEPMYDFIPVNVVSMENGYSYIDTSQFEAGDNLINVVNSEHFQLGKTGNLEGVYNVNKGYAVFKIIERIYENKEYVIVKKGTPYGLSAYDHIVVNAETIENSQLIKQ